MISIIKARIHQKYRTTAYPAALHPPLPGRFNGHPVFDTVRCPEDCRLCEQACPTDAISIQGGKGPVVDLGRCLFCNDCLNSCPHEAVSHSKDHRLAVSSPDKFILEPGKEIELAEELGRRLKKILGRSLTLREVSAGGCNACEADINVLGTVGWDLGRFGIHFTASPRHADGLVITGPVTDNMRSALLETYESIPEPKIVIAVGACAISGGPYIGSEETNSGIGTLLPVDMYIPGCPPHPLTILDGLLRLIGRIKGDS